MSKRQKHIGLTLLVVSLIANGAMLWIIFDRPESVPFADAPKTNPVERLQATPSTKPPSAAAGSSVRWEDIASDDFEIYAKNLRKFGCPESVIADFLIPEVNQKYYRLAAGSCVRRGGMQMGWMPAPEWNEWIGDKEERELRKEHERLITSILGEEHDDSGWHEGGIYDRRLEVHENRWAGLGDGIEAAMDQLKSELDDLPEEMRKANPEISKEELIAGWAAQRLEKLAALKQDWPAEQIEDVELRQSKYAKVPRDIAGIELSADEMRAIVREFESTAGDDAFTTIRQQIGEERFTVFEPAARKMIKEIENR